MKYLRLILIWGVITLGQGFTLLFGQQDYPNFSCLLEEFPEKRSFLINLEVQKMPYARLPGK